MKNSCDLTDKNIYKENKFFIVAQLVWTILILLLYIINIKNLEEATEQTALVTAKSHFEKDIIIRKWAASHGGVYAPQSAKYPPNPYLAHIKDRDINTTSGKKLTLVNPAYMTRQIYELASSNAKVHGHITSLHPIRQENKPDEWEAKVLRKFNKDIVQYYQIVDSDDKKIFRFMGALYTEKACLACHEQQGYKLGDIRGGISISFSYKPFLEVQNKKIAVETLTYFIIWMFGAFGILISKIKIRDYIKLNTSLSLESHSLQIRDTLLENLGEGVYGIDTDGCIIFVNDAACNILGYTKAEMIGRKHFNLFVLNEKSPLRIRKQIEHTLKGEDVFSLKCGRCTDVEFVSTLMSSSFICGRVIAFQDITKRLELTQELYNLATRDPLTNILNRRKFDEALISLFLKYKRNLHFISIIIFDIDFFKVVNDTYGHQAGDLVLKEITAFIKEKIRDYDGFYRIGGEEFCLILEDMDESASFELAERIRKGVENLKILSQNDVINITISAGISSFEQADLTHEDVISRADNALYEAKGSGRNRIVTFGQH